MSDVSNLRDTIIPKSDQLNADQLLGGEMVVTVNNVRRGDGDQPIIIGYDGDNGRPYKPCKSMRKVLVFAWGEDGNQWVGRSMTLFCDTNVMFGGIKVGGIRISHMTDIERDVSVSITATRGKKTPYVIKKLDAPKTQQSPQKQPETPEIRTPKMIAAFAKLSVTEQQLAAHLKRETSSVGLLSDSELKELSKTYKAITTGGEDKAVYFPSVADPTAPQRPADSGDFF